ncbi:hypothetical protein CYY_007248 [Polysphondylium violaceum]|uniref:SCP domain-containing protein n=1 Tax=Polysphondylium violaceum TaxID=133409 RepID=A0A8J4PNW9_9MYCE|nr:hypothetical protein CYY_007248 [Polysphondylium violaceum]
MKLFKFFTLCFVFALLLPNVYSYGEGSSGLPNWHERENHVMVNSVRMDPRGYVSYFMKSGFSNLNNVLVKYPAVNPLYYNNLLNQQAQFHSQDMGVNACFEHDDCDGGSISDRFKTWSSSCKGSGWGENIAAGYSTGLLANNLLICEESSVCVSDGSNDGHRSNMMASDFQLLGVGYYYNSGSKYKSYWTQDFKSGNCDSLSAPIYSASHTFYPDSKNPNFLANYYNSAGETLSSAQVILADGTANTMSLILGSANKGVYSFVPSSYTACSNYKFVFKTTNGKTYTYPDTGSLKLATASSTCDAWSTETVDGTSTTEAPTTAPTQAPTVAPTIIPTTVPTEAPTNPPTEAPTNPPTEAPTNPPTQAPTEAPTNPPTEAPTNPPTQAPTEAPTKAPTNPPTEPPTQAPTEAPTEAPTNSPTEAPTNPPTEAPTDAPATDAPTNPPTEAPTNPPTEAPTDAPATDAPTNPPTEAPTDVPITESPTDSPTTEAPTTESPTDAPATDAPTTESPTDAPATDAPTTEAPTDSPATEAPTDSPTTESPTTNAPVTEAPTTDAPTTESPTTEAPTTESPTNSPIDNGGTIDSREPDNGETPEGSGASALVINQLLGTSCLLLISFIVKFYL